MDSIDETSPNLLPPVYDVRMPFRKRLEFYYDGEVLDVPSNEVESQLKDYISEEVVYRLPFKALIQVGKEPLNFLVACTVISVDGFDAVVEAESPFRTDAPEDKKHLIESQFDDEGRHLSHISAVYPAGDMNEDPLGPNYIVAMAIEHIRFFYSHIWRNEDLLDDSGELYSTKYVTERLVEAYGMDRDVVPKESLDHLFELLGNVPHKGEFRVPKLEPESSSRKRLPGIAAWVTCVVLFFGIGYLSICSCESPLNITLIDFMKSMIHFMLLGQIFVYEMSCQAFQTFLLESILVPLTLIHMIEALYAAYLAWKTGEESVLRWFFQTIFFGIFSLRLIQDIHKEIIGTDIYS